MVDNASGLGDRPKRPTLQALHVNSKFFASPTLHITIGMTIIRRALIVRISWYHRHLFTLERSTLRQHIGTHLPTHLPPLIIRMRHIRTISDILMSTIILVQSTMGGLPHPPLTTLIMELKALLFTPHRLGHNIQSHLMHHHWQSIHHPREMQALLF